MGHYTGPKARINRRLGTLIYENSGAARAMERRESPPGMHTRTRRPTNYGMALMEKRKIKHYYGIGERQLRRLFNSVAHTKGNTGELLLLLCERRLDNVVYRLGFANSRQQARQLVRHGHFLLNGRKTNVPSCLVKSGDIIAWRPGSMRTEYYKVIAETVGDRIVPGWLAMDTEKMVGRVLALPLCEDIEVKFDGKAIVEYYSR